MIPGEDYWDSNSEDNSPFDPKTLLDSNPTGNPDWDKFPAHVRFYYSLYKSYCRVVHFSDDEFKAYEENLKDYLSNN